MHRVAFLSVANVDQATVPQATEGEGFDQGVKLSYA